MPQTNYSEKLSLKNFILGIQHLIAMFGATILVPILTKLDISVALFSAGVGTLIFHFCTKRKVPVFLGSSFAFIAPITAVAGAYGSTRYAQGGIVVAGLIYVIFSLIINKIGVGKIKKLLPAQVIGPMIMVIGLNLVPVAFGMASSYWLLAILTLGVAILINIFGKGFLKQLSIIIAVSVGYIASLFLGQVDTSIITKASIFAIPQFTLPIFNLGAIAIIAPIVLAVFMEHVGDITTNGQVVGKNFVEDPGLNKTLLGDGLATLFAGFIGGPANTTYGENTGVLAITKNYNPTNIRIAAIFAIILAFVGKLSGILNSIPVPVMGGISLILFSMIGYIGVQTIQREKVEFNIKNIIIMISVLFLGLAPTYLKINVSIPITEQISFGGLSLAAVVGVVLNLILNRE